MNRETIEKAAREAVHKRCQCYGKYPCKERDYCEFCNGHNAAFDCSEDCDADAFDEGFIEGAQWRINSVWHSPDELPNIGTYVIALYEDNHIFFGRVKDYCNSVPVKRWAYVDDLLPGGKEGE